MKNRNVLLILAACFLVLGCGKKNKNSPFNGDASAPLVDTSVHHEPGASGDVLSTDFCKPDPNGPYGDTVKYSDKVTVNKGHDDTGNYDWGDGGACVNRPIREVWAVLNNQAAMVWGGVTTSSYSAITPPAGIALGYSVNYHVDNGFPLPSVDWVMDWFHTVKSGTNAAPVKIVIRYQKVSGTTYISMWEGDIVLDYISPTVTAIRGTDHINASRTGPDDSAGSVQDVIQKARDREPNWQAIGGK
jgi:hypothetical protein